MRDPRFEGPIYQTLKSNRVIRAALITSVSDNGDKTALITVRDKTGSMVDYVTCPLENRPFPHPGYYLMVYDDGYISYAPPHVIESGYMSLEEINTPRLEAYAAIDSERAYQDAQKGNASRHEGLNPVMTPGEFLTYMRKCLRDAEDACYRGATGAQDCLPFIRKVCALGVSCMEKHGAPRRDGF